MNMSIYSITIAEKIKDYRRKNNLSQSKFGELLNISAQAVCKWEQVQCYPDITMLPLIAQILDCSVADFFEYE